MRQIIEDVLRSKGLELIDLIYRFEGRDLFLRVLTDRPEGGISLGECANLNREIGAILDQRDILRERYVLEVSSPGIDRPLLTKNDFIRCLNRDVHFFLLEPINAKIELEGRVERVEGESVFVDIDGEKVRIELAKIRKGKQVVNGKP